MYRKLITRLSVVAAVATLALAAACGGERSLPVAPDAPGASSRVEGSRAIPMMAIHRSVRLDSQLVVTGQVGRDGGMLELPEAGFWLYVPEGAVRETTVFTIKTVGRNVVAYEFGPEGATFDVPIYAIQSLESVHGPDQAELQAGYFSDPEKIDTRDGVALVDELLPVWIDTDSGYVVWEITHFSGYLLGST